MTDNGFLKLDNSIIDYWMSKLNHSEFKTLLTIYRKTVGWNKKFDRISQSQIAEITGLTTRSIRTAITSLEELDLIITSGKDKSAKVFALNSVKLFDVCLKSDDILELESKLEEISQPSENNTAYCENNSSDDNNKFLHKRQSKDTNKKQVKELSEPNIPFSDFWKEYDYAKGKKSDVEAKWLSLTDEERTLTMQSLEKYKQSTPDKTFRKYPMTYLNTEAWNDEVVITDITNQPDNTQHSNTNNPNNTNNPLSSDSYSASFKPFEDDCGTNTSNTFSNGIQQDSTCNSQRNNTTDIVSLSSQVHWSELKAKGYLKPSNNPNAVEPNSKTSKSIDDFLNSFGSKGKDCKSDKSKKVA